MSSDLVKVPTSNLFTDMVLASAEAVPCASDDDLHREASPSSEEALSPDGSSQHASVLSPPVRLVPKTVLLHPLPPAATPQDYAEYLQPLPKHITPLDFLARKENIHRVVTRSTFLFLAQFKSLSPVEEGDPFPLDAKYFTQLSLDICKAQGNVHHFALDTKAEYAVWMRTSATSFVRRLFSPATVLPKFEGGNLSVFDSELHGSSSAEEFPYNLLSIDALYRIFFLDLVFPYYVYLYAKDIRSSRLDFTPEELKFLSEFDYYSFVAFITYVGSLLLLAAEGYSRVLFEGVRWMLIRAYCVLGILSWDMVKGFTSVDLPDYTKLFRDALSPVSRFSPVDSYGDSYARYGWKLFEQRPRALYYLASMTQIAFFNNYRFRPEDDTELKVATQFSYLNAGFVPYLPPYMRKEVSDSRYPRKELGSFRTKEYAEEHIFYPTLIDSSIPDVSHEWYFLFDVLNVFKDINLSSFHRDQKEKLAAFTHTHATPHIPLNLNFPMPPSFGIRFTSGDIAYRFDLASYVSMRYFMTFNRLILDTIPSKIEPKIRAEDFNDSNNYLALFLTHQNLKKALPPTIFSTADDDKLTETQMDAIEVVYSLERRLDARFNSISSPVVHSALRLEEYCKIYSTIETTPPRNPLESWEFYILQSELKSQVASMRKLTLREIQCIPKYPKKQKDKSIELLKVEPKVLLPRPPGRHPDTFFFAVSMPPHSYQTMFVTIVTTTLYAAFSGPISNAILAVKENHPDLFEHAKYYKAYPYIFLPLEILCSNNPVRATLDLMINAKVVTDIYRFLSEEYTRPGTFSLACDVGKTPPTFKQYLGSVSAIEYLEMCSKLSMNPVAMDEIAALYSIPVPVTAARMTPEDYAALASQQQGSIDVRTKYAPGRVYDYSPRFTDTKDLYIRKLLSPDMTAEDKELLFKHCEGHTWKSIEARARVISKKMLEEERVFNINILPVRNYTAKTRELLERNFNAALNIDPRLKVDDTKKTEAALRKKYLTPRPRRPL